MKLYSRLEVSGFETLVADPVTNLFTGRIFYNTTTSILRIYNGTSWVDLTGVPPTPFEFYNKRVGPGESWTTLTDALFTAVSGDRFLVTGDTTETAPITITASNIMVEWLLAKTTINGAGDFRLKLNGDDIRLIRPDIIVGNPGQVGSGHIVFNSNRCHIEQGKLYYNGAYNYSGAISINATKKNNYATLSLEAVNTNILDGVLDNSGATNWISVWGL